MGSKREGQLGQGIGKELTYCNICDVMLTFQYFLCCILCSLLLYTLHFSIITDLEETNKIKQLSNFVLCRMKKKISV